MTDYACGSSIQTVMYSTVSAVIGSSHAVPDHDEVLLAIRKLIEVNSDPDIIDKARHILNTQNG